MTRRSIRNDLLDWRDRHIAALAGGTIIVALFVLGAATIGESDPTIQIAGATATPAATEATAVPLHTAPPSTIETTSTVSRELVASGATPPERLEAFQTTPTSDPVFRRGECGWIAAGLEARGVTDEWVDRAVTIATRESDCCPNVQGGDLYDNDCTVTGVGAWHHRSDTGAFQFNWVWYRGAGTVFCDDLAVCEQGAILADHELQLDLFIVAASRCGLGPWNVSDFYCEPAEVLS